MGDSNGLVIKIDDDITLKREDSNIKHQDSEKNDKNNNELENTTKQQNRSTDNAEIGKNTPKITNLDGVAYDERIVLRNIIKILKDPTVIHKIQQNHHHHSQKNEEKNDNRSIIDSDEDDKIIVDPEVIRLLERSHNSFGSEGEYEYEDERDNTQLELPTEIVDTSDSDALLNEITDLAQNLKLDDINMFSVLHSVAPLEHILDEEEMISLWPKI